MPRDWRQVVDAAEQAVPEQALPADLRRLMEERRAIEQRMSSLTGGAGAGSDPRTAALYEVQPLAVRNAELRRWQDGRDQGSRERVEELAAQRRTAGQELAERLDGRPRRVPGAQLPLRPTSAERERARTRLSSEADRFLAAREQLREPARAAGATGDRLMRALDAASRAKRVIEDDWVGRRERIGGPDLERYQSNYQRRTEDLLGVAVGSITALQERSDQLRAAVLDRRREASAEQARLDERCLRARERRSASRDDEQRDEARRERASRQRTGQADV